MSFLYLDKTTLTHSQEDTQTVDFAMLRAGYDRQYVSYALSLLAVLLGIVIWYLLIPETGMLVWTGLVALASGWGIAETLIFKRSTPGPHNLRFWQRLYFFRSIVTGLAWGSGAALLVPGASGWEIAILIAVYLCLNCVVIDILMPQWHALLAFLLCSSGFLVIHMLDDLLPHARLLALVTVISVSLCALVGWSLNRNLRSLLETQLGLQKATTEAEAANRHKSQFLSNMSHEIRTPMNAVLGMIQLLSYTQLSERQQDYLQKTDLAAHSLLGLLNNILDFSKIEAGKMELERLPFHPETLLRELEAMMITDTAGKPVSSRCFLGAGIPEVLVGDVMRLRQVLTNLVSNAIKFTGQGEVSVTVSLRSHKPDAVELRFSVRDTGIGIAPENQGLVFEEFTQADAITTRRFGGTGLGLSISKRLIDLMGGTLQLRSTLGQGSHFFFDLLLAVSRDDATASDRTALPAAGMNGPIPKPVRVDEPVRTTVRGGTHDLIGLRKPGAALSAADSQNLEMAMLKAAYDRQYLGMGLTAFAMVIGLIAWHSAIPQLTMLIWIVLIGLTGVWGTAETFIFKRTVLGTHNLRFWQRLFFCRSILTGMAWGSEASLVASGVSGWDAAVVVATYLCLNCVIIDILMAQWRALAALLLCANVFLVAQLLRDPQPHSVMLAVIMVTAVLLCALVGWSLNRNLRSLLETELGLKKAKTEAETANRHKSLFLSNMSHEIRTPMNAVLGMIQLLGYTPLTDRQQDYVQKTAQAATLLLDLLNNILDFSKIEAGKMELDILPFRPGALLRDLEAMLITDTVSKPVSTKLVVDAGIPEVLMGDVMRLRQVLTNLVSNAMKFTERGEVMVTVSLRSHKPDAVELRFSVRDTGIGIAPENQGLVFEEFTQADAITTRRFGGTGLGLSISKRLIAMMGGTLQLQSTLGQGSHFFFDLVLAVPRGDAFFSLPGALKTTPSARLQGLRLLLVEDNLLNRQVAMELLQGEGAEVTLADHGAQALDVLRQRRDSIDVVLMDLQMPVMDGYAATRAIRGELGLKDLPVIAMTANAMVSDRAACLAAGMNEHVPKPIHVDHLVRTIVQCRTTGIHTNPGQAHSTGNGQQNVSKQ